MKIMIDSEYLDKLQKSVGVDSEGNAVVGKNLEVDGTTKLNGGFEPIHSYPIKVKNTSPTTLKVWAEIEASYGNYQFIGELFQSLSIGRYYLENGKITALESFSVEDGTGIYYYSYYLNEDTGEFEPLGDYTPVSIDNLESYMSDHLKTLFGNQSLVGEGNIDLYRHRITVNGVQFEYISSSNLVCDSVQDLRTLIKECSSGTERYVTRGTLSVSGSEHAWREVVITPTKATIAPLDNVANTTNIVSVEDEVTTI